jgi:hypothetical protein
MTGYAYAQGSTRVNRTSIAPRSVKRARLAAIARLMDSTFIE